MKQNEFFVIAAVRAWIDPLWLSKRRNVKNLNRRGNDFNVCLTHSVENYAGFFLNFPK